MRGGKAILSLFGGTKFGKVVRAAGKKLATTPEQLMRKSVTKALNGKSKIAQKAKEKILKDAGFGSKGFSFSKGDVTSYPKMADLPKKMRTSLTRRAAQERMQGGEMLKQWINPNVDNPALSGMGAGLENIHSSKLGATRLRRWGGVGAAAWTGSNFLRRGDQVGPF